jgi:hypothetical protein
MRLPRHRDRSLLTCILMLRYALHVIESFKHSGLNGSFRRAICAAFSPHTPTSYLPN